MRPTHALAFTAMLISVWTGVAAAQAPPAATPPRPPRVQPPARITEFRAQPETIRPGQAATLIWATENPNGVEIDPEPGRVTPRGSRPVRSRVVGGRFVECALVFLPWLDRGRARPHDDLAHAPAH